ncbi:MAG: Co2+/Mg2+ efflux protein ApaG [Actinomycetota bacterium]|nr:Co2+/Mg2+ efflux protein ApaG [Actinomycetota bacterium]
MSEAVTEGIRVSVQTMYIPERSDPKAHHYFFAYHITISNEGDEAAQLLSRKWIITDGDGEVSVVEGPGVIGEQPHLAPGAVHEYTSFCPLPTPVGSMHGTYTMVRSDGRQFDAIIAPFTLALKTALN